MTERGGNGTRKAVSDALQVVWRNGSETKGISAFDVECPRYQCSLVTSGAGRRTRGGLPVDATEGNWCEEAWK
jgi:hypothetical protein